MNFEHSVVINRPVEQVFTFTVTPANMPLWFVGAQEATQIEGTTMGVGAKVRAVGSLLGKRIETITTCTGYEANRALAYEMTQPFSQTMHYTFEAANGGTRLTIRAVAEPGGFFKLAMPVMAGAVRRNAETSLNNLKDILESQA